MKNTIQNAVNYFLKKKTLIYFNPLKPVKYKKKHKPKKFNKNKEQNLIKAFIEIKKRIKYIKNIKV